MNTSVSSKRICSKLSASKMNQLRPSPKTSQQPNSSKLDKEHILKMIEMWEAENNEPFEAEPVSVESEEGLEEIDDVYETPEANEDEAMHDVRERQRMIEIEIKERMAAERKLAQRKDIGQRIGQFCENTQNRISKAMTRAKSVEMTVALKGQENED